MKYLLVIGILFLTKSVIASDTSFVKIRNTIAQMTSYLREIEQGAEKDQWKAVKQHKQVFNLIKKSPIPDKDSYDFDKKIKDLNWTKVEELCNNYFQTLNGTETFLKQYYKAFIAYTLICHTSLTSENTIKAKNAIKRSLDNLLIWKYDGFHAYYLALKYLKYNKENITEYKKKIMDLPDVYTPSISTSKLGKIINTADAAISGEIQQYKEKIRTL